MDITEFYQTFFDEADELLQDMEQHLLELDPGIRTVNSSMLSSAARTPLKVVRQHSDSRCCRKPHTPWKTCLIKPAMMS